MTKIWKQKQEFTSQILPTLSENLGFQHSVFLPLLANRGVGSKQQMEAFFREEKFELHDPFLMKDMDVATERIEQAINNGEKILVYGDYDVDGTTAVALVYQYLHPLSNELEFYIPDRHKEGYGISRKGIDYAVENNFKLIIALDCGIKSNELVQLASDSGVDFIICDHHLPGDELPPAVAILDPKRSDCTYPFKELSGCAIGFKLCEALESKGLKQKSAKEFIDLVAVSLVSDLVELNGENRDLVKIGLNKLSGNPSIGLKTVIEHSIKKEWVDVEEILFMIGPRINAAGRLATGRAAVELLIAENESDAGLFTEILNQLNTERRTTDQNITKQALRLIEEDDGFNQKKTTIVFHPEWHKGVIGIVASRLQETHYRPTIVFTKSNGLLTGSARSIPKFNIYEALLECQKHLEQFGGHKFAAGMTLKEENLEAFSGAFDDVAQGLLEEEDLIEVLEYDIELDLSRINAGFLDKLKKFGPFGPGNPQPLFLIRNMTDSGYARTIGSDHSHLKLNLRDSSTGQTISGIGFNLGKHYEQINQGQPFDLLCSIEENHFNGQTSIQLNIKDIRPL